MANRVEFSIPELNQVVRALGDQLDRDRSRLADFAATRDRLNQFAVRPLAELDGEAIVRMAIRETERALRACNEQLVSSDESADEWYEALWKDMTESEMRAAWGDR